MKNKFFEHSFYAVGLIVLSFLIVIPYFKSGYFPTHDGEWAVVRLGDMFRTIKDFQFPPRYSEALNFGYGYPLFNFAYPFPYYLSLLFYIPLQSFILSIKATFVLSVFGSALFMYFTALKLWNHRLAAFLSSVLYLHFPYRMVDLYVRGNIGESLAFAIFPVVLFFSLRLFDSPYSRVSVVCLSALIGILVMNHNIMTILFMPTLLTFILSRIFFEKRWDVLQSFLLSIAIGAGLSFFFWFPALYEKKYIALSQIPIADRSLYFININQALIPSWGYAPPTESNGFSYHLGLSQILVILITSIIIIGGFIKKKLITPAKFYAFVLLCILFICFAMMFSFTNLIWQNLPLLSEINYPWTMLSQIGFIASLLLGFVVIQGQYFKYLGIILAILAVLLTVGYAKPEKYNNNSDQYYLTNEATTTSSDELMPIWVKEKPLEHYSEKVIVIDGQAEILDLNYNSKSLGFSYKATTNPTFRINTIYYPGWRAYVNTTEVDISYDNPQGVMEVKADMYSNRIYLEFGETLPRTLANGVSIVSLLVLGFIALRPILLFKNEN